MVIALALLIAGAPLKTRDLKEGPIDFVCNAMQVYTEPNHVVCERNVVVRRNDLLLCCDRFEGYADADGEWERLVCEQNVRARRNDELMWSDKATYIVSAQDLILTGRPELWRAGNLLRGDRIIVDTELDRAQVEKPQGRMVKADNPTDGLDPLPRSGPLPRRCPVPNRMK